MKNDFDSQRNKVKILDFMLSVERLENAVEILNTFYELCSEQYEEFWRIKGLINDLMEEYETVHKERKEIRELFLD